MRPLYSLKGPIQCDQCVNHPAVGLLVARTIIDVQGYGSQRILQVRALCQEYLDAWAKQLQENGSEVATYPISEAQEVHDLLEKEDPGQLINFEDSFRRKERK